MFSISASLSSDPDNDPINFVVDFLCLHPLLRPSFSLILLDSNVMLIFVVDEERKALDAMVLERSIRLKKLNCHLQACDHL